MQDAEIERQLREIDVLPHRIAGRLGGFVESVEVGSSLHLYHREAFPVVEVEVAAVLQEGATNRYRPLVVERRAIDEEGGHAVEAEAVIQPVGVLRVFFVYV